MPTAPARSTIMVAASPPIFTMFFFFKQKTAYEIGLGIPAEPLFRSFLPLDITCRRSDVMSKGKKRSGARPGRPQPLRGTKGKRKGARLWYVGGNNFNCRGFGPLLEDKLCLIFKLAPSVCRMTFPILASLLVRLVVLLPFQLLRLSLATPSRWTPLALSVFLHCVVALLLTLL